MEKWVLEYSASEQWINVEKLSVLQKYEATGMGIEMGFITIDVYDSRIEAEIAEVNYAYKYKLPIDSYRNLRRH